MPPPFSHWPAVAALKMNMTAVALAFATPAFAQKVLNFGIASPDIGQVDPHKATTTQDKPMTSWAFNGLVRFKPGSADLGGLEPDLAGGWQRLDNAPCDAFHAVAAQVAVQPVGHALGGAGAFHQQRRRAHGRGFPHHRSQQRANQVPGQVAAAQNESSAAPGRSPDRGIAVGRNHPGG